MQTNKQLPKKNYRKGESTHILTKRYNTKRWFGFGRMGCLAKYLLFKMEDLSSILRSKI